MTRGPSPLEMPKDLKQLAEGRFDVVPVSQRLFRFQGCFMTLIARAFGASLLNTSSQLAQTESI